MSTEIVTQHPNTVKEWLQSKPFMEAVEKSLPSHLTPDRFIRIALTAMMKVPKLAQCTKESIFRCMLDLSSLGLEPDGRRAHIIPYGNVATLIIDYKGLIELAKRSGDVASWRAETVCEADSFSWDNGIVTHGIEWRKPRGKLQAVYSHVRTKDGLDDYEVMTIEEVEAIQKRSKAATSGPWKTDFSEMAKKTVIRRHSKRLTLSPEFMDALARDSDKIDLGYSVPVENIMPRRASEAIAAPESTPEAKQDAPEEPITPPEETPFPDAEISQPEPAQQATQAPLPLSHGPSEAQIKRLYAIGKSKGYDSEQVRQFVYDFAGCTPGCLSPADYKQICSEIEKMVGKA